MSKRSTPKQINRRYHNSMKAITKGSYEQSILEALTNGKNTYLRVDRTESSSFDNTWIDVIEGVIFDLGEIVQNPRLFTRTEGAIVPVELARKTNAESVQHLASHTQYIKDIDEFGNVVPSKIMTILHEDDIKTYENRFIATFIRRLVLFVEKRYEVVAKMAQLHDEEVLMVKNKSTIDGCEVEVETRVKISHPNEDAQSIKTNSYIQRIEQMRNYILYFYNSQFMHQLRTEKDVHKPILQTNIIRKNPKYHHCYEVFKFIEGYSSMGVSYKVDEDYSVFNDEELKELNRTLFANYITRKGKDRSKESKGSSKVYKPRIITSEEDDKFVYGKHLAGPFEFVRADEQYREYLRSKLRDDLPKEPTEREKEFYKEEYEAKDELRQDEKELRDLIKRIKMENAKFQKEVERLEIERELARLALEKRQKEVVKAGEDTLLEEARDDIVNAALADEEERRRKEEEERRKFLESIKPAEEPVPMSHPYSRPVTFEQACIEIWPILGKPQSRHIYREEPIVRLPEEKKPEPVVVPVPTPVEEQPVEETTHPAQQPLTFDEAVKQIWPQIRDVNHEFNKEEPVQYLPEEQPVQEQEPQPVPVPVPVPEEKKPKTKIPGKFVVYIKEEGFYVSKSKRAENINNARVFDDYREAHGIAKLKNGRVIKLSDQPRRKPEQAPVPAPVEEPQPQEEAPVEEPAEQPEQEPEVAQVVEEPQEQPEEEAAPEDNFEDIKPAQEDESNHPEQEPVSYDEAVSQIWPQVNEPVDHEFNKEEPVERLPDEEPEEQPQEEPQEEPQPEEPVVEEAPEEPAEQVEEAPEEQPVPEVEPEVPAEEPVSEPEPEQEPEIEPEQPAPAPAEEKEQPAPKKKIPGRFVVYTDGGYYVSKNKRAARMKDALVFKDYQSAHGIAKLKGGRVVKL